MSGALKFGTFKMSQRNNHHDPQKADA